MPINRRKNTYAKVPVGWLQKVAAYIDARERHVAKLLYGHSKLTTKKAAIASAIARDMVKKGFESPKDEGQIVGLLATNHSQALMALQNVMGHVEEQSSLGKSAEATSRPRSQRGGVIHKDERGYTLTKADVAYFEQMGLGHVLQR